MRDVDAMDFRMTRNSRGVARPIACVTSKSHHTTAGNDPSPYYLNSTYGRNSSVGRRNVPSTNYALRGKRGRSHPYVIVSFLFTNTIGYIALRFLFRWGRLGRFTATRVLYCYRNLCHCRRSSAETYIYEVIA